MEKLSLEHDKYASLIINYKVDNVNQSNEGKYSSAIIC
jgi:hypothetical protein